MVEGWKVHGIGRTEMLAYKRHLDDLESGKFHWNVERANHIINFMECLTIAEGENPAPLKLADFQAFFFGSLNGWEHHDGRRRYRTSYIQVARQNGKSLVNGGMMPYYGNYSGYMKPQVYCASTKLDQSKIVLREAIKFIQADEELEEDFKVKAYENTIDCKVSGGFIQALGKDTKGLDGKRGYFISIDEYHEHQNNDIFNSMHKGQIALKECLMSVITTAGRDLNAPCKELYEYCKQVLEGVIEDDTQFVFITELDKDDDPYDEKNWRKANPLWTETRLNNLRASAIKAKNMGGAEESEFFTKNLNMWVDFADNSYIQSKHWKQCESDIDLETFLDMHPKAKCYVGLDLSSGGDLTSLALVFVYQENGQKKYYVFSHSFMPAQRVIEHENTDKVPYRIWIRNGLLSVTETLGGIKTDYAYVIEYLRKMGEQVDIQAICYDPHNASAFLHDLESLGYPTVMITQSARNLNDATCDFQLEVEAGNVKYDKSNALMTWSVINARVVHNSFKEKKVEKLSKTKRIDTVDAILDAWKLAMGAETYSVKNGVERWLEMIGG